MKKAEFIMGMPITVEVVEPAEPKNFEEIFGYFRSVDERFSPYKPTSEVSRLNRGELPEKNYSPDLQTILSLAAQTKQDTQGYFDIRKPEGQIDPSGLVKGWAIWQAAKLLDQAGLKNYYVEAGGDVQLSGTNHGQTWTLGIKNPFNVREIVKVLHLQNAGIATSGSYERGDHIYNPHQPQQKIHDIVSLTVIGPNVYEADRFATAAFAMGVAGIQFIESLPGFEGFMIDRHGIGTETSDFSKFIKH